MKLSHVIRQTCDTMGVRIEDARAACERALVAAAEEVYGDARAFEASYDEATDEVELHLFMQVVDVVENPNREISAAALADADTYAEVGEDVGFRVFYLPQHTTLAHAQDLQFGAVLGLQAQRDRFGRIAVHQAKQALVRALRDAERAAVCDAYEPLVGQLVAGIVDKVGRHDHVTVSLGGGISGLLPRDRQHPRDRLSAGEWLWCEVESVSREDGPPLTLTRVGSAVVAQVLPFLVADVDAGRVVVEAVAREAGVRCKVAVSSRREDINPVAACVGEGGEHVRELTELLLGERVDIVLWDDDPVTLAASSLGVAVVDVGADEEGLVTITVRAEDMPLAVGRGGENLRLARRLSGVEFRVVADGRTCGEGVAADVAAEGEAA